MNTRLFLKLLEDLTENDWQKLLVGEGLQIIDDQRLRVSLSEESDMLVPKDSFNATRTDVLKQQIIDQANELLSSYYLTNPLCNVGFNDQVKELVSQYGHDAFIGVSGQHAEFTLFVEGGEVVVESVDSPRHPYGVFMELDNVLSSSKQKETFTQWLLSGEAYQQYIGMNVCRYNC